MKRPIRCKLCPRLAVVRRSNRFYCPACYLKNFENIDTSKSIDKYRPYLQGPEKEDR